MPSANNASSRYSIAGYRIPLIKFTIQSGVLCTLLAIITFVPLLGGSHFFRTVGKVVVFQTLSCVLIALLISQVSIGSQTWTSLWKRLAMGPTIPLILLVIYAGYSYSRAPYKSFGFARNDLTTLVLCVIVYCAVALYVQGRSRAKTLVYTLLGVAGVVALIGLCGLSDATKSSAVTSTFGTHETLGSFLTLTLPVALALGILDRGQQARQIFAQIVAFLLAACLLITHTRSAWAASAVSIGVLSLLILRYREDLTRQLSASQRRALAIGPAFIFALAVAIFIFASHEGGNLATRAASATRLDADRSAQIRKLMFDGAFTMFRQKPLLGWGIGSYPPLALRFSGYGDSLADLRKSNQVQLNNNAHNFYVQFGAEMGGVGLAIYCAALAGFFVSSFRALKRLDDGFRRHALIGIMAAVCGQMVDAVTSPSYYIPSIQAFQFLLLGLGMLVGTGLDFSPYEPELRVRKRKIQKPLALDPAVPQ